MLEHGRHHVRAGNVLGDRADHVEHPARGREGGVDAAALGIQDRAKVFRSHGLDLLQKDREFVDALRAIRQGVDAGELIDGGLQSERPSCVVEEETFAAIHVVVDVVEAALHLLHQCVGKEFAFSDVHSGVPWFGKS